MNWHDFLPYLIFGVSLLSGALSGMVGGGGGFIITPFFIAIGLTPQQAIATAKLGGAGLDVGSIAAFRGRVKANQKLAMFLTAAAALIGIAAVYFIRHLQNHNLQQAMGTLILLMMPFILIKHHRLKGRKRHSVIQLIGIAALMGIMLLQGVFSSGIGSLENVILILTFGLTALQASLIKRQFSVVMDLIMIAGLAGSGLINFNYGFIALAGCLLGGFIGSRFAIKKGEKFARYALMALMLTSGIWLIATA
jgi:uncharacterized membrane protein YfcA